MFDLGWSKMIIIAMVAIIVVGPKELPTLLRTLGAFVGKLRRQADEFRSQLSEALKDTEFEQIRKDVADLKSTATGALTDITSGVEKDLNDAQRDLDEAMAKSDAATAVSPQVEGAADASKALEAPATDAAPPVDVPLPAAPTLATEAPLIAEPPLKADPPLAADPPLKADAPLPAEPPHAVEPVKPAVNGHMNGPTPARTSAPEAAQPKTGA